MKDNAVQAKGTARKPRIPKQFKSLDDLPLMLSVYDIMDFFNKGQKQAYEMVHREDFPSIKDGVNIITPKWLLIEWVENQVKNGGAKC